MLSKNNKILIGCLALLLVMSVGYALFSDTITINGSATAKGDFELTTTCDMDGEALEALELIDSGSVTGATITCNDNVVNASATLGYPGSRKWFRIMVTNTGTIPAKLKRVVELNNPDIMYFTREEGWSGYEIENCQGIAGTNYACARLYLGDEIYTNYESPTGIEPDWSQQESEDPTLDPGETAYFYVYMEWSSSSTTPGEPLTPTLNAQLDWEQVTQ